MCGVFGIRGTNQWSTVVRDAENCVLCLCTQHQASFLADLQASGCTPNSRVIAGRWNSTTYWCPYVCLFGMNNEQRMQLGLLLHDPLWRCKPQLRHLSILHRSRCLINAADIGTSPRIDSQATSPEQSGKVKTLIHMDNKAHQVGFGDYASFCAKISARCSALSEVAEWCCVGLSGVGR